MNGPRLVGDAGDESSRGEVPSPDPSPAPRKNRVPKRKARPGVDRYGRTPLWLAAADGNISDVLQLLDGGMDPNQADDDGYTPLHVAAQNGRAAVAELLLDRGADPSRPDHHGNGPVWTAAHQSSVAGRRPGHVAVLVLLLGAGADVDRPNRYGRRPREILDRSILAQLIAWCRPAASQS